MTVFALLASALAAVGIAGVTARQVAQRTRELGIRKALGARDDTLVRGVLQQTVVTGALGVALGLATAFWLRPLLAAFLFGVESFDPLTYGGMGVFFVLVSAVAAYLPARRLLRVDPVEVLKVE